MRDVKRNVSQALSSFDLVGKLLHCYIDLIAWRYILHTPSQSNRFKFFELFRI